jgi:hypothetical protein
MDRFTHHDINKTTPNALIEIRIEFIVRIRDWEGMNTAQYNQDYCICPDGGACYDERVLCGQSRNALDEQLISFDTYPWQMSG